MIFDKYLSEIRANQMYLTEANWASIQYLADRNPYRKSAPSTRPIPLTTAQIRSLKNVDPAEKVETPEGNLSTTELVTQMGAALLKLQKSLGNTEDPKDLKTLIDGYDKVVKLLVKHREGLDSQTRQQHIEEALIDVLDEIGPEAKTRFLSKLESKLG